MDATTSTYTCEICGATFDTFQRLGGHKSATHRSPGTKPGKPKPKPSSPADDTLRGAAARQMKQLADTFRVDLDDLNRQLAAKQAELDELRRARTFLEQQIRKLDPGSFPAEVQRRAKISATQAGTRNASYTKKTRNVRDYLETHAGEAITGNQLAKRMRAEGIQPTVSEQVVHRILKELHQQGVIRADRVTRGGGMAYIVTGTPNGEGPDGKTTA